MDKKIQIMLAMCILVIAAFGYIFSTNYVTGKDEIEWFKESIVTNWNLRFVFILVGVGGILGYTVSRVIRKGKAAIKK